METSTGVRFRPGTHKSCSKNGFIDSVDDSREKRELDKLHGSCWLLLIAFYALVYMFVHFQDTNLPLPRSSAGTAPTDFSEERARVHLNQLTALGPRYVGNRANEIDAVNLLMNYLKSIKSNAHLANSVEIDLQTVSGSFDLEFLGGFNSNYANINNVLAKIGPPYGSNHSLLVNCHYDSVAQSPGASDDAVSCAIMMETLRAISQQKESLLHNIIFIFNGAEENILQASHGFITQHPWASTVRAFVNLEAAGAGGRELVFQTGPEHPWLIQSYASSAVYPFASSFGQEVFQSGVIPSDTDFRIYRDFGNIPGIDIAYVSNGYVYHTHYDTPEKIEPGCIQRGGENLLATLKTLVSSPLLVDPSSYRHGNMVFFDFVGIFMVIYPERLGTIINSITVIGVVMYFYNKINGASSKVSKMCYIKHLLQVLCVQAVSWVLCILFSLIMAALLTRCGRGMSWYFHTTNILGMYICPAVLGCCLTHYTASRRFFRVLSPSHVESMFFDSSLLVWTVITAILTYYGLLMSFYPMLCTLCPLLIRDRAAKLLGYNIQASPAVFLTFHFVCLFIPSVITVYIFYGLFEMFIPVLGRVGTVLQPDLVVAVMVSSAVIFCSGYQAGLLYAVRGAKRLLLCLAGVITLWLCLVLFTPLGFPYNGNPNHPALQRSITHHVERRFHDIGGSLVKKDSGIWYIPFDHNQMTYIKDHVPSLRDPPKAECDGPYCGWPYYYPMLSMMPHTYYIPAAPLTNTPRSELKLLRRTIAGKGTIRLYMSAMGFDHSMLYIVPRNNMTLNRWSLGDGHPEPIMTEPYISDKTYFCYFSYGTKPKEPWTFWFEFEHNPNHPVPDSITDIAIASHYINEHRFTPELNEFLGQFPDWTYAVGWSATYDAFVF